MDPDRLQIRAHAETKPLVPNASSEQRAINRRVEIVIAGNEKLFMELNNEFPTEQLNDVMEKEESIIDSVEESLSETHLEGG